MKRVNERETGSSDGKDIVTPQNGSLPCADDIYGKLSDDLCLVLEQSRASVPPLEVALDDEIDDGDVDNGQRVSNAVASEQSLETKRSSRQLKKREKEERYEDLLHSLYR